MIAHHSHIHGILTEFTYVWMGFIIFFRKDSRNYKMSARNIIPLSLPIRYHSNTILEAVMNKITLVFGYPICVSKWFAFISKNTINNQVHYRRDWTTDGILSAL